MNPSVTRNMTIEEIERFIDSIEPSKVLVRDLIERVHEAYADGYKSGYEDATMSKRPYIRVIDPVKEGRNERSA